MGAAAGVLIPAAALAILAGPAIGLELPEDTDAAFAEAYNACTGAIAGGATLDESLGWTSHDSGDPAALVSDHWSKGFATKDVEGVGSFSLSVTVEQYPGYDLGLCSVSVDQPEREIDAPAFGKAGVPGTLQGDSADWWGLWRDADGTAFLRASFASDPAQFRLSLTTIETTPQ
jgi:hypothetical protein